MSRCWPSNRGSSSRLDPGFVRRFSSPLESRSSAVGFYSRQSWLIASLIFAVRRLAAYGLPSEISQDSSIVANIWPDRLGNFLDKLAVARNCSQTAPPTCQDTLYGRLSLLKMRLSPLGLHDADSHAPPLWTA